MSDRHTLLIVEDDPGFSGYLKRLLRNKNLHILTANSGRQAFQFGHQHHACHRGIDRPGEQDHRHRVARDRNAGDRHDRGGHR